MVDPPGPPHEPVWLGRLLPRSVLGITALILAASLGAAFSGAVLYAYYEYRRDTAEKKADQFAETFAERLETAIEIIETERDEARQLVRDELEPLEQLAATGQTLERLRGEAAASVFFVTTLAEDGSPAVGTAFVVFSDAEQSFLLTSLTTVRAATRDPRPPIRLRQGSDEVEARLVSWEDDGAHDLALLSVDRGNLPRLPWAERDPIIGVGDRVFAVSGLGAGGGAVSQGLIGDVSGVGLQHDAPIGPQFQGSPLLNSSGEVVGMASRAYAPLGFAPDAIWFAPFITTACERVLQCPG